MRAFRFQAATAVSASAHIRTRPADPALQHTLENAGTQPLLARLYAARGVEPQQLDDHLAGLLPYTSLKNCEAAATILADAVQQGQRIVIAADYDADGATACAVGIKGLSAMGATVDFLVPNRFTDGYGLTPALAEQAHQMGAQLLLTVDNGIAATAGVARAQQLGLQVIVTDHHLPGDSLPDCLIVNPNQHGCGFASKNLAGVGVMFYVLMALRAQLRGRGHFSGSLKEPNLAELLDLVALGTVADVVPLDHNNRILVSQGLKRIRAGKMCAGIRALFETARRDHRKAQPFDMGFALGPRINAAGRLDDMSVGIACLLADNRDAAAEIAEDLNDLNQSRQQIEQGMIDTLWSALEAMQPENRFSLCLYREDFHQGVIGIVAGRLKERFHRPTIVFAAAEDGQLRGSGRSITGLHLRDALDLLAKQHPDLIVKFGGHAMAAGLSIRANDFNRFQAAFEQLLSTLLDSDTLTQTYLTDGSLHGRDITLAQAELLQNQVWGQGFPQPSFDDEFTVVRQQFLGSGGQHKKAWLQKDGYEFEAMFWRCQDELPPRIRTVYRPTVNEWRGQTELQLYIDYWERL